MKNEFKFPAIFNYDKARNEIEGIFVESILAFQSVIFMTLKYEHGVTLDESHEGYITKGYINAKRISFYTDKNNIGGIELQCDIDQDARINFDLFSLVERGERVTPRNGWEKMHEECRLLKPAGKHWVTVEEFADLLPNIADIMKKAEVVS